MEEQPEPIVIRVPQPATPSERAPTPRGARARGGELPGLILAILGGFLLDFSAILPWWQLDSRTEIAVPAEFLVTVPGRSSWQGVVCLVGGSVILVLGALWNLKRLPRKGALAAARAMMVLASLTVLAATWGAFSVPAVTGFDLETTIWPWVAASGGVLALTGGALLHRPAPGPATPLANDVTAASPPSTTPSSGFLINSMQDPNDPSGA